MEQYINKNSVLKETDRMEELLNSKASSLLNDNFIEGVKTTLLQLRSFLDTLEAKEVDLEKEIKEDIEDVFFDLNGVAVKGATHYLTVEDVKDIAKHFFELGLRSTITEEDCKLVWDIGDKIPYMPEEEFFKELLKRYKAQKGE